MRDELARRRNNKHEELRKAEPSRILLIIYAEDYLWIAQINYEGLIISSKEFIFCEFCCR